MLASLALMVAAGGGIGGGGMLVPLYILVLRLHPQHAIALSNATILGGAIANTALNAGKKHAQTDRSVIDWDLIIMMEPGTIGAAVLGALLAKVLPGGLLTLLLSLLLALGASRTLSRGSDMWRAETLGHGRASPGMLAAEPVGRGCASPSAHPPERRPRTTSEIEFHPRGSSAVVEAGADPGAPAGSTEPLAAAPGPAETAVAGAAPAATAAAALASTSRCAATSAYGRETATSPAASAVAENDGGEADGAPAATRAWRKAALLTLCFAGACALSIAKGGPSGEPSPVGATCGSAASWLLFLGTVPWVCCFACYFRRELLREHRQRVADGCVFHPGEVQWDTWNTIRYPVAASAAGLVAGVFGVGGGIVKGPLMLEMGVPPAVASASAAVMILYTSASATVSYITLGLLHLEYAAMFFALGLVCTTSGHALVHRIAERRQRQSPVVLSIGTAMALSAAMVLAGAVASIQENGVRALVEVGSACDEEPPQGWC